MTGGAKNTWTKTKLGHTAASSEQQKRTNSNQITFCVNGDILITFFEVYAFSPSAKEDGRTPDSSPALDPLLRVKATLAGEGFLGKLLTNLPRVIRGKILSPDADFTFLLLGSVPTEELKIPEVKARIDLWDPVILNLDSTSCRSFWQFNDISLCGWRVKDTFVLILFWTGENCRETGSKLNTDWQWFPM